MSFKAKAKDLSFKAKARDLSFKAQVLGLGQGQNFVQKWILQIWDLEIYISEIFLIVMISLNHRIQVLHVLCLLDTSKYN